MSVIWISPKSQCQFIIGNPIVDSSTKSTWLIKTVGFSGVQLKLDLGFGSTTIKELDLVESTHPLISVTVSVEP